MPKQHDVPLARSDGANGVANVINAGIESVVSHPPGQKADRIGFFETEAGNCDQIAQQRNPFLVFGCVVRR
jgi:hypothetical protein